MQWRGQPSEQPCNLAPRTTLGVRLSLVSERNGMGRSRNEPVRGRQTPTNAARRGALGHQVRRVIQGERHLLLREGAAVLAEGPAGQAA